MHYDPKGSKVKEQPCSMQIISLSRKREREI
jgi:hypothetical protein